MISMAIDRVLLRLDGFLAELQEKYPGYTLKTLAGDLGMNPRSITALKRGTEKGEWITLCKLAEYLSEKLNRQVQLQDLLEVKRL